MPQAPSVGASQLSSSNLMSCLREVDADGFEAAQVLIDHVVGRRLQDHLQLLVLVEAIGIFAIAAVGGAAAGLDVGDAIGLGAEDAQKGFGGHGARADFDVVGLLDDAAAVGPILLRGRRRFPERIGGLRHRASRRDVRNLRSTCCSIVRIRKAAQVGGGFLGPARGEVVNGRHEHFFGDSRIRC